MKHTSMILLVLITLYSCNKEDDVPNYHPGRLTELACIEGNYSGDLYFHKFEYSDDDITDFYYCPSPELFSAKYHFNENKLGKIYYTEKTNGPSIGIDSIIYSYSDSLITETHYFNEQQHEEYYILINGKIISSTWSLDESHKFLEYYFEWSGDNLIRVVREWWYGTPLTANITELIFEYSDIENPLYINSNIPRMMKEIGGSYPYDLFNKIPRCSRNFPLKITTIQKGPLFEEPEISEMFFECKTFPNTNKPYEINAWSFKYSLTYEKL